MTIISWKKRIPSFQPDKGKGYIRLQINDYLLLILLKLSYFIILHNFTVANAQLSSFHDLLFGKPRDYSIAHAKFRYLSHFLTSAINIKQTGGRES